MLAAGRGTRVAPLTAETPKCLLRVGGRPLLDRQLEALAAAGIDDVTVVAGFMADDVARHVGGRCRVVVNGRFATTGSIASLAVAAGHVRGGGFLVQNGDTLYPAALIRRVVAAPRENVCLVDADRPYRAGEYHVEVADGRVVRYCDGVPAERSVGESGQLLRVGAGDGGAFLDRVVALAGGEGAGGFPNRAYDVLMGGRGLWPAFTAGLPWWEVDTADDLARCDADHRAAAARPRAAPASLVAGLTAARAARFLRSPSVPYRLRWLPPTIGPLCRHPARVGRDVRAFHGRRLSLAGLDLAANGTAFLRLATTAARAAGFDPFLLWGTLLGCVRGGGFIRGDHDIDLGVLWTDAGRLPEFRRRMGRRGFGVRIEDDHKLSLVHPRHPRLFVDVDVVRPHRDGWAITSTDADARRTFRYHFPAGVFAGTRPAAFGGRLTACVPADAAGFLAAAYGDWRTPAPRVDHRYGPLNTEVELFGAGEGDFTTKTRGHEGGHEGRSEVEERTTDGADRTGSDASDPRGL